MNFFSADDFPIIAMEASAQEIKDYFSPKDFMIGGTVNIAGRRFLMYVLIKSYTLFF